jgi:hypothetical protein
MQIGTNVSFEDLTKGSFESIPFQGPNNVLNAPTIVPNESTWHGHHM